MPSLNYNGRYLTKNIGQNFSQSVLLFFGPKYFKTMGFSLSEHY
jgi:hypothetical protein